MIVEIMSGHATIISKHSGYVLSKRVGCKLKGHH